jgi:formylglycine-generating enzyme required for sulfatase activity
MSPEQVQGRGIGPSTDLFSFGAVFFELLTLQRPFAGDTTGEVLNKILRLDAVDPRELRSGVPSALAVLTMRCLEKHPVRRPVSAVFVAEELSRFLAGQAIRTRPRGRSERAIRVARAHPTATVLVGMTMLAAIGFAALTSKLASANEDLVGLERALQAPRSRDDLVQLRRDFDTLHPVTPAQVTAVHNWISRTEGVLARRDPFVLVSGELHPGFEALARSSTLDVAGPAAGILAELNDLASLERGLLNADAHPDFGWGARRLLVEIERMNRIAAESRTRERWTDVARRLGGDPRFRGLELTPQVGLVPIGPDPATGLEEFWHVLTGEEPTRDEDGLLEYRPDSGVVLVLLPGGSFQVGAQSENSSAPLFDSAATPNLSPLPAFQERVFVSKFEITVGQWKRLRGEDPSSHRYGHYHQHAESVYPHSKDLDATLPVNSVSHREADAAMRQVGLLLPSAVEWEYAARAGTTTTWWTGRRARNLRLAENLRDWTAFEHRRDLFAEAEPWRDGWVLSAPAAAFLGNPFGLHHTLGNVREWLRVEPETNPRHLAGSYEEGAIERGAVGVRGGDYNSLAVQSSASMPGSNLGGKSARIGVRPVRPVVE